ncbi:MAG: metallophosphoesterase [Pseudomonadota bacterium]
MRFLLLATLLTLSACATDQPQQAASLAPQTAKIEISDLGSQHGPEKPWTSLDVKDGPKRFSFAVITDRTGGERKGKFGPFMEKVNLMQPAFVMSVGDLIQGYTQDAAQIETEWAEFDGFVDTLDAPFFYVAGNHDYMNAQMEEAWRTRFGASYYHFLYKDVLFLVLNSELLDIHPEGPDKTGGPGHAEWHAAQERRAKRDAQFAYAKDVLAKNPHVRWTFVFVHKPFWREGWELPPRVPGGEWGDWDLSDYPVAGPWPISDAKTDDWTALEGLLDARDYTVFAGHRHTYHYEGEQVGPHTHDKITLATTGGTSNLRGPAYGEFDQTAWITMTDNGPVIANVGLEEVLPKDLETPKARPWWVE